MKRSAPSTSQEGIHSGRNPDRCPCAPTTWLRVTPSRAVRGAQTNPNRGGRSDEETRHGSAGSVLDPRIPASPALVGKNLIDVSDKGTPGKPVFKEFVQLARSKGEGWIEYQWPKPGSTAAAKKTSYICRVPGKDLLVGAGTYE